MTVIAFDGKTLAADKFAFNMGTVGLMTKIRKVGGHLVGVSGPAILVPQIWKWAEAGFTAETMPVGQKDPKEHAVVMAISPDCRIWLYENDSVPWLNERPYWAIGLGREVALGVMAEAAHYDRLEGAAMRAVAAAGEFMTNCGRGCDTLTFEEEVSS